MDVESKLGQSLDDLIKSQKKPKKKQGTPKGKKGGVKPAKKGAAKTPTTMGAVGKKGGVKTPVSGGVKKASRGRGRQVSSGSQRGGRGVTVVMRGGKGLGYGLGPKDGVTRRQRAPSRVTGTTGESINSRFEKIYQKHASGARGRSRGGGSGRKNSYGVVMPL